MIKSEICEAGAFIIIFLNYFILASILAILSTTEFIISSNFSFFAFSSLTKLSGALAKNPWLESFPLTLFISPSNLAFSLFNLSNSLVKSTNSSSGMNILTPSITTLTASSVSDDEVLVCIQRNITNNKGKIIEEQEIKVDMIENVNCTLAVESVLLIYKNN